MQYIYSRVSTDRQDTQNQVVNLKVQFPDASVVEETATSRKDRPLLKRLLSQLKRGDTLIVYALDRLGRKTSEVIPLIEDLERRGIILKSIREGLDYATITGRLVTQIMCSVAEMERSIISERIRSALEAKRRQGVKLGRPRKYGDEAVARVKLLRKQGCTLEAIAAQVGISVSRVCELCRSA